MYDLGRLRPVEKSDLQLILSWRNHPETRRFMLSQHVISPDEHADWFQRMSHDPSRRLLVYEYEDIPLGFVNFSGVRAGAVVDWGFYSAPTASKGTGRRMGLAALKLGFEVLKLHKICGQALDYNKRSIRYHLNLGFKQEGVLREHCEINGKYYGLVCFGLLSSEWRSTVISKIS